MKTTISLAQINVLPGNVAGNYSTALGQIEEAARQSSQLILLPELWPSGYDLENREKHHRENQAHLPQLLEAARQHQVWIGGSWIEEDGGDYFNTFNMISPQGDVAAKYSKIHLFGLMDEFQWLRGGSHLQTLSFPWGKAGLAVCYDLRFPELFRRYALDGVSVLLLVAQWPARRIDHWSVLLRARAIENQMFVLAVNNTGQSGDEVFGGKSTIINPWGEVLAEGPADAPCLLTAEIDLDEVERARKRIPVFKNRRPDLY